MAEDMNGLQLKICEVLKDLPPEEKLRILEKTAEAIRKENNQRISAIINKTALKYNRRESH